MIIIEVLAAGGLTTIQDLGRPGWAHIGVPRSGAADRDALIRANRLVGNADGAAALETTLVGPTLRAASATAVALTGAPVNATVDGASVPMDRAFALAAGATLSVGRARSGLRTYIAFAGGIAAALTLGSAATDVLTGLGPPPLRTGDRLTLAVAGAVAGAPAPPGAAPAPTGTAPAADPDSRPRGGRSLRLILGPREDWFTAAALTRLTTATFRVTPRANRIGLRLSGPALERAGDEELRSEGLVPGAIQAPPSGEPVILLVDHPTTGGYPVIAVVSERDISRAAQLRPGDEVRFEIDQDDAVS